MYENIKYPIFNRRDKLSERKEELLKKRKEIKQIVKQKYKDRTIELKRSMQIFKKKEWKVNNPIELKLQKHRRYLWSKESNRLRNMLLE